MKFFLVKMPFKIKLDLNIKMLKRFLSSKKNTLNSIKPYTPLLSSLSRENFIPFDSMVELRRNEAKKSVVIEVQKDENIPNLQSVCSMFGNIKNMLEFKPSPEKYMVLVEFEEEGSLKDIVLAAQQRTNGETGSIQFPFLKMTEKGSYPQNNLERKPSLPLLVSNESSNEEMLHHMKHNCNNVSEQIQYFYDKQKMTEIGWRLRFLTCRKIEWILPGILSHAKVLPFGSSVNTFGNNNCDLDMVVDFSKTNQCQDFPLVIQPGKERSNSRGCTQKNLELIADLVSFYMPGFTHVIRVLHANVPIIKCNETFTGLECDITASYKSGYYMSELLYLYGCSDPRVRPLVFSVRWWAKQKRITRKNLPGRWFSNFTTTIMVLFYLMNTPTSAIIPAMDVMQKLSDTHFTSDGITYSYVRDVTQLPVTNNNQSLEELLAGFFNFYSEFNYKKNAISINSGKTFKKPDYAALYIQNPIEKERNVSKNVNLEELETFKTECILAAYNFGFIEKTKSSDVWGLIDLFSRGNETSSEKGKKMFNLDLKSILEGDAKISSNSKNDVPLPQLDSTKITLKKKAKKKKSNGRQQMYKF